MCPAPSRLEVVVMSSAPKDMSPFFDPLSLKSITWIRLTAYNCAESQILDLDWSIHHRRRISFHKDRFLLSSGTKFLLLFIKHSFLEHLSQAQLY